MRKSNIILFLGMIEVEGKSVPEQKVIKLSNKQLETEIQEFDVLLKGKLFIHSQLNIQN